MSINIYTVAGRVGKDAEATTIGTTRYAKCNIAVPQSKDNTQWIEVLLRDEKAQFVNWIKKGDKVTVCGRPTFSAYGNKQGDIVPQVTLWASSIELPDKNSRQEHTVAPSQSHRQTPVEKMVQEMSHTEDTTVSYPSDDLPF